MELPRGEDEPLIERRRHPEDTASPAEVAELFALADELLNHAEPIRGTESIRRGTHGTFTLQSSIMREDGINVVKSGMYVTGPHFPQDRTDVIAELEFSDDYAYPTVTFRSAPHNAGALELDSDAGQAALIQNQERGREALIDLLTSGKLDKTESALALYCLSRMAEVIDDLSSDIPSDFTKEDGTVRPFAQVIADQIAVRTSDFSTIRNVSYADLQDEYELYVTSILPSNPKRPTDLPRLQIFLTEGNERSSICIIVSAEGTYHAVENDPYSDNIPTEAPPEVYHIQRLTTALKGALQRHQYALEASTRKGSDAQEMTRFIPRQPYSDLLDAARTAWLSVVETEEDSEEYKDVCNTFNRAMSLLRNDFESRYHLMPGRDENGEDIALNLPNAPHFNMHHFHSFRNMIKLATSRVLMLIGDDFHEWPVQDNLGFIAEYNTIEGGTIVDGDGNEIHDIFLVTKPNVITAGSACIVPLSQVVILEYAARNN